jgi:hypothetical protein
MEERRASLKHSKFKKKRLGTSLVMFSGGTSACKWITELAENGDSRLFVANGKWKWQTSVVCYKVF